jgi:peptidoglycan hydrolase-like protein with peptidoglycan-binding domain
MPLRSATSFATAAVTALALPAAALAQGTPTTPTTPAPPPPAAQPAPGALKLSIERGRRGDVLVRDGVRVNGFVRPYVAGQKVVVRFFRGGRRIAQRTVAVTPGPAGKAGFVIVPFSTKTAGRVTVRAEHAATPEQAAFKAEPLRLDVLPYSARPGSRGRVVRYLQRKLAALHYVVGRRGVYDDRTARAVLAFRKVVGMPRTYDATPDVFGRIDSGQGAYHLRFPRHGKHVEADLSRQVLVLARGGRVERIYPTSSGKPSTPTVRGTYRVYRKEYGTNSHGMVHSSYFIRGYAIHGYAEVPTYAASHGCLRVPVPDALAIYDWVGLGDIVDVYW